MLAVVLGTAGAWLLHRYRFRFSQAFQTLVAIPMVMPEILMGISLLILFVTIGLDLGYVSVIVGHVTFSFPFVLVAVQARLQGLDPALEPIQPSVRTVGARPDVWAPARSAATHFWQRAASDTRLSEGMRSLARTNQDVVERFTAPLIEGSRAG